MIPEKYKDFYYLRDIDLNAKRLADYPFSLNEAQCQELYKEGWLFKTHEDAMRVREVMRRAYVNQVMQVKGADSILFKRPSVEDL